MLIKQLFNDNNRKCLVYALLLLFLLFLLCQVSCFTKVNNILLFTLIVFGIGLIIKKPYFLIRYMYFFFGLTGNVLGVYIIEQSKLYLTELNVDSSYAGSLPLLVTAWSIFLIVLLILDMLFPVNPKCNDIEFGLMFKDFRINCFALLQYFMLLLVTLLWFHLWQNPFYLEHMDRFAYQLKYVTGGYKRIFAWCLYCVPVICYMAIKEHSKIAVLDLVLYVALLFWTSEKFGGFFNIALNIGLIYSIYGEGYSSEGVRNILVKFMIVFVVLLSIVFIHRGLNYKSSITGELAYFKQRIAQQGQLWWRTYNIDKNNDMRFYELDSEINTFFETNDLNEKSYNHAIYKIMRFTTPLDMFWRKIDSGSRYSTSTFASFYYYFKEIGVIAYSIIGAIIFWIFHRMFIYSIKNSYFIETLISARLLTVCYVFFSQSEFNYLFSIRTFVYVIAFLVISAVRYKCCNVLEKRNNFQNENQEEVQYGSVGY